MRAAMAGDISADSLHNTCVCSLAGGSMFLAVHFVGRCVQMFLVLGL